MKHYLRNQIVQRVHHHQLSSAGNGGVPIVLLNTPSFRHLKLYVDKLLLQYKSGQTGKKEITEAECCLL